MPTTVTSTIGTSSRDYSTIQAWEDACPANLVTDDKIWRGECYNDSEFSPGSAITIGGVTTDATRYLDLTAAAGQSFQDHANIRTNPLTYDQAKGVGIKRSGAYDTLIAGNVAYTRISRLQLWNTATPGVCIWEAAGGTATNQLYKDLIAICTGGPVIEVITSGRAVNCVAVDKYPGAGTGFRAESGGTLIGCLALKPSDVTAGGTGFLRSYGTPLLQSCACFGFTTPASASGWDANSKNNATDQASGLPGSSNQYSVSYTQTTPFTDADKDSLDLRAVAATALAGAGFKDATNAPNDISATARAASPTIGAWELAGGGPASFTLTADAGSFAITGTAASLKVGRRLTAAAGAFTISGTAAALRSARRITAAPGAFAITGTAATLTYQPVTGAYTLPATPGAFAITGTAAGVRAQRRLVADPGSLSISGATAGLLQGRRLAAAAGAFAITGTAAALRAARRLAVDPGVFVVTGTAAGFSWSGEEIVISGIHLQGSYVPTVALDGSYEPTIDLDGSVDE